MQRRTLTLVLFSLVLALIMPGGATPPPAQAQQPQTTWDGEIRGFWVDAWNSGFKTPAQVTQLIADAHTANANTLFVQVRRRGDSYYNESAEPRVADSALDPAPYDPLATLITAAHNANPPLKVYAWVVAFPVWGDSTYTTTDPARHVYYRHGKDLAWDNPENWLTYHYDGQNVYQDVQLDPGHPAAARYTVDACLYLLRHYDVDGLTLDYIRYDGQNYGYNKVSEDRFHAVYGGSGHPPIADANWSQWRRDQVTNVVRQLYVEAHAVKPDVVISAATIAWGKGPADAGGWTYTNAYWDVFQDWRSWLDEGILDLALPMNYDRDHDPNQSPWFSQWIEWQKDHQFNRAIATAQGSWINYITGTLNQIRASQAPSSIGNYMAGASIYSYASTNAGGVPNSTFYAALAQPSSYGTPPWSTWKSVPTFSWLANPTPGHLMGWAIGSSGPVDGAAVTISGPENRTVYADGNGFFSAVDLLPGAYTITGAGSSTLYATVTAGRTAIATITPSTTDPELRAVLVDVNHDGFKTPDQVDTLLADVRAANLNTVIVQVRQDARLYYNSSMELRTNDPEVPADFDPLGYLLQQAHGGSPVVEVYAWMPMYPVWDGDTPPSNPAHLFNQHPDWLTQDMNGNQRSNGIYHLDPGHPGTQQYLLALVGDLLDRYSVDGLFLDNLYYPPENSTIGYPIWGYNATAVQRFHASFGGSGSPDPADANWMEWRRDQASDLLRQIYVHVAETHPHVRVAVSAIDWGDSPDYAGGWEQSSAYGRVLQNWQAWLQEGILDLAAPQNYDRDYDTQQAPWYDHWLAWENGQRANRGVLVLQGSYLNYPEDTLDQIAEVPGNAVGFSNYIPSNLYADPDGNSRSVQPPRQPWYYTPQGEWWLWRALAAPYGYVDPVNGAFYRTSPLFPGAVSTPAFPWKDTPTLGQAYGTALDVGGLPLDGTSVYLQGPVERSLVSDAFGFFAAVDLPPGDYMATVEGADPARQPLVGRVSAGQVTELYPCVDMTSVTIVGALRLTPNQTGYFATAVQPPEAGVVLQYDWSNGSTSSPAAYSWPDLGLHTVAVTVTNACSQAQGSAQVEVIAEWPEQVYLPVVFR